MTPTFRSVRLRLFPLWLSVFAFALGETAVRVFALRILNRNLFDNPSHLAPRWLFFWLFFAAVPVILLAPLLGAIMSSRFRWLAMLITALLALAVVTVSAIDEHPNWLGSIGLLALTATFFSAGRLAMVPEIAKRGNLALPHVEAFFTFAAGAGMAVGILLGYAEIVQRGMPLQIQAAVIALGVTLVALLFVRTQPGPNLSIQGGLIGPFLRTSRAIARSPYGRNSLIGLWGLFLSLLVLDQCLIPDDAHQALALAVIIGIVLGGLHGCAFRSLGRVPFATAVLFSCGVWALVTNDWYLPALVMGGSLGTMLVPLLTNYQVYQPEDSQGHGAALLFVGSALVTLGFLGVLIMYGSDPVTLQKFAANGLVGLCFVGAVWSWLVFFRPFMEMMTEWLLTPAYRVRAVGPGATDLPWKGPCIIVANHAAWFDPLWLAKVLPCPTIPMMTSKFYDIRGIAWIMRKIVGTIRVPHAAMRREAPEIQEAIAALDRGECLVMFPEGWLRRKEDQVLRRFGRGIWQILSARPNTPVYCCWIEGNWGSYVSHKNGPPTKNKPLDFRRPIDIVFSEPRIIDANTLANHLATRLAIMRYCLEARAFLGLPPWDGFSKLEANVEDVDEPDEDPAAKTLEATP